MADPFSLSYWCDGQRIEELKTNHENKLDVQQNAHQRSWLDSNVAELEQLVIDTTVLCLE